MLKDVRDALRIARHFAIWDSNGPGGDLGSFKPIEVSYDDNEKVWIVECEFTVERKVYKTLIRIDEVEGLVKGYQRIE